MRTSRALLGLWLAGAVAVGCGDDSPEAGPGSVCEPSVTTCACGNGASGLAQCTAGVVSGCSCQGPIQTADGSVSVSDAGSVGPSSDAAVSADGATAQDAGPPPASGPKDGEPSAPEIAIEGVACRASGAGAGVGGGLGSTNLKIGGRDLVLDYPCGKHEGAHLTFILNLHGTMTTENLKLYQRGYFSAHRFVGSHDLVITTPKTVSPMGQWGNQDNGQDEPHLLAVIDWVYKNFAKANIRSMWVGGHSWGGMYTAGLGTFRKAFVCHDALKDKVKGAIAMSGGGLPSCSDRVSLITTRGATENITLVDQSSAAMKHGCTVPMAGPEPVGNNEHRFFAACQNGFAHEDYSMTGKGHTDSMDVEVVQKIVESIKASE